MRSGSFILRIPSLAAGILAIAAPCFADSDDELFLEGLRQRRLFDLATGYCEERLQQQSLDEIERATLTIELIRTHAARAVNQPPAQRDAAWKQAHDASADFLAKHPGHPREILIRVQDALTHLARGQLVRQEMEAGAGGPAARDVALQEIRAAANQLEDVDKQLTREIPLRNRIAAKQGELTAEQLLSLQNHVRFQLARAYRNRALCYDKGTNDRIDALTRVLELHRELLAKLSPDDPLRRQIYIDGIACHRLLGNFTAASQVIGDLRSNEAPAAVVLEARAEEARLKLAQGKPHEAIAVLQRGRKVSGQVSAELDFAHVEAYNALAQAADNQDEAAKWQRKAVAMMNLIEQTHGPYWARRANLLLVRSATGGGVAADLSILVGIAEEAVRKQQFDQAVAAYENAADKAAELGDSQQAFVNCYRAALVQQQRAQHSDAAKRMRELALTMKAHADASAAHLMAIWNASALVRQDQNQIDQYVALLEEHIATWPEKPTADQARMWLAVLLARQQKWEEAVDLYLAVDAASEHFAKAVESASKFALAGVQQRKADGRQFEQAAKQFAQRFADIVVDDGRLPAEWSAAQRTAAVAAAQLRLEFVGSGHAEISNLLKAVLLASPDADPGWKATVRSLLVVSLAGQSGGRTEARELLNQLADGSPDDLLGMATRLDRMTRIAPASSRAEIAGLALEAANLLLTKPLNEQDRRRVQMLQADALVAMGEREKALTKYEQLAQQHASNGPIQVGFAQLLLDGQDKKSLEQALVQWRKIDRASRPRSDRWWQAKYSISLAHYKLSVYYQSRNAEQSRVLKQRAAQLLRYLKITPPGWDESPLKAELDELLKLCDKSDADV